MVGLIESIVWMTLNVYFEARGEPLRGKMDIVHVVHNRARLRKQTIKEVITASKQFSWVNPDAKVQDIMSNEGLVMDLIRCAKAVYLAEQERLHWEDRGMIDHYFNPGVVVPPWAAGLRYVREVKNHAFYTSEK